MATLCDFTLASQDAKFGYPEVHIGFMPALISAFVQLQVREKAARDLLLTGRVFGAIEAQELGLVNRVVPAGVLQGAARELVAELMANSPHSLLATKRLLVRVEQDELDRRLELGIAGECRHSIHTRLARRTRGVFSKSASRAGRTNEEFRDNSPRSLQRNGPDGVVYHGNYLTYFEIGRVEYLRDRGMAYKDMEQRDDSFIVVAESHCRYLRPARYDDVLRIRTRVSRARRRTLRFAYEIVNDATGELLATGETVHVVCNKAGRPRALPDKYWKLFAASGDADASANEDVGETEPADKHS